MPCPPHIAIEMFHDTELEGRKLLVREDREEGKLQQRRWGNGMHFAD